jgi:hypothetical protein
MGRGKGWVKGSNGCAGHSGCVGGPGGVDLLGWTIVCVVGAACAPVKVKI